MSPLRNVGVFTMSGPLVRLHHHAVPEAIEEDFIRVVRVGRRLNTTRSYGVSD
jgi:hypothetical protein